MKSCGYANPREASDDDEASDSAVAADGGSSTDDPASSDGTDDEIFILCRSRDRSKKEEAMVGRSEDKIEQRLTKMTARCEKQKRDPMLCSLSHFVRGGT